MVLPSTRVTTFIDINNHENYYGLFIEDKYNILIYHVFPLMCEREYHHHHHVVPSLAPSPYHSLLLVGLQGYIPYPHIAAVRAGRPAFTWSYTVVHWSTSLMSSSLLLQQCPAWLVRLTCIVFVMGGRWPYSWCLVGCFLVIKA